LTAEAARLLVPNLLLGNTILLTNTRSYPQQAQRIGEIIDAGGSRPGLEASDAAAAGSVMG